LDLLPSPPALSRVGYAVAELHELGALTPEDTPTVLGSAFLKVPLDVPLARFVILGWCLGSPAEAAILAGALSLAPSCDVLRTPFNGQNRLGGKEQEVLKKSVELRRRFDRETFSEPITVYNMFVQVLEEEGYMLGWVPKCSIRDSIHQRLWCQFTEKVCQVSDALLRLVPPNSPEAEDLDALVKRMRRSSAPYRKLQASPEWLAALLAWGLAPLGFVAVGQTPALYPGGQMEAFADVVNKHGGDVANALSWPKTPRADISKVVHTCDSVVLWQGAGTDGDIIVGTSSSKSTSSQRLPDSAELMCRLCGPFNGKDTFVSTYDGEVAIRPPRHPCMLNWYILQRRGGGSQEVSVSWKSQLDTMVHIPRDGDRGARCRPKHILVAGGGAWKYGNGRRTVTLRGSTLLPTGDGGRSALLWLLAGGMPGVEQLCVLAAPIGPDPCSGDFEIRALRLWRYTLHLRDGGFITKGDLRAANDFRTALVRMQRRRPHRLAGVWRAHADGQAEERYLVEYRESPASGAEEDEEVLSVTRLGAGDGAAGAREDAHGAASGRKADFELRGRRGSRDWGLFQNGERLENAQERSTGAGLLFSGRWVWQDTGSGDECIFQAGRLWTPQDQRQSGGYGGDGAPLLSQLGPTGPLEFRRAAQALFEMTRSDAHDHRQGSGDACRAPRRHRWPARLAPLVAPEDGGEGCPLLAPFDLDSTSETIRRFGEQLGERDAEHMQAGEIEYDVDDASFDISQENLNEDFMWRLAQERDFSPQDARNLYLCESAIALPREPVCCVCEGEGKTFSKRQLTNHPDWRKCTDCVNKPDGGGGGAAAADASPSQTVCSTCGVVLSQSNCSASQRQKASSVRKCTTCTGNNAADATSAST